MLERECLLHTFVLDYARKLSEGIADATMNVQPAAGMNTPLWIYGHLAVCTDYALMFLGQPMHCPKRWHKAFGPGSDPAGVQAPFPAKQELLAAMEANFPRIVETLKAATAEQLAQPHSFEPTKKTFPTTADMIAHLLTTHPTLHLGQLSAWRRFT